MTKKIGARFSLMVRPKDGVTYVIRTAKEYASKPKGTASSTFTSDYRFFKRVGDSEYQATFYVFIYKRATNGTRTRVLRVASLVHTVSSMDISLTSSDEAIEVFCHSTMPSSTEAVFTDYAVKKEIPVQDVALSFRCRWMVNGVEQNALATAADGTPKGEFPTRYPLVISLMANINGQESVVTDSGSLTVYALGTDASWSQSFTNAPMNFSLQVTGSSLPLITNCTGIRAVWVSNSYGTKDFAILKVKDGELGPRGYGGPVLIPAGAWKSTGEYIATPVQTQYVYNEHDDKYYMVTPPEKGTRTATVGKRPDQNPTHWTSFNTLLQPLYAALAIINGGTVGKGVFWEEFMYSQFGRRRILDNNHNVTGYEDVDATHGTYGAPVQTGNIEDTFEPNLLLNFLSGDSFLRDAYLENGFFTGFKRNVPTVITGSNVAGMVQRSRFLQEYQNNVSPHQGTEQDPNNIFFNLKRVGSSIVISSGTRLFVNEPEEEVALHLPFLYNLGTTGTFYNAVTAAMGDGGVTARREMMRVRSYVGCSIEVLNISSYSLSVFGMHSTIANKTHNNPWQAFYLQPGHLLRATCKRGMDYGQYSESNSNYQAQNEIIYWELEAFLWGFNSTYFDAGLLSSLDD